MACNKILVCCHKEAQLPQHEYFYPIQVGCDVNGVNLPYAKDNTGDNISAKNRSYCELTAMYWAWKNLDCDIIGLNHYRRYFDFGKRPGLTVPDRSFASVKDFLARPYHFPDLEAMLSDCDIILPPERRWPYSLYQQYCIFHIVNDWNIMRQAVAQVDAQALPVFDRFFYNNNALSNYNMFICRKPLFDDYCQWLFGILEETERNVKLSAYPDQGRLFGYLGERLINVYCQSRRLKARHIPVVMPIDDDNAAAANPSGLAQLYRNLRNDVQFHVSQL